MREVGFVDALAFAGADALGLAEDFEEVTAERLVRQLDRAVRGVLVTRQAVELLRAIRHLIQGVQQHFRAEPFRVVPGVVLLVVLVEVVRHRRQLIGAAFHDGLDERLQTELVVDQVLRQCVEQVGVRRRVGHPHIVGCVHDAAGEEVCPVPVGNGFGEERILQIHHPLDELVAGVVFGSHFHRCAVKRFDRGGLVGAFIRHGAGGAGEDHLRLDLASLRVETGLGQFFATDPPEERREAPVIVLAPLFVGVVVAVCTRQPLAEEHLGHIIDVVFRLLQFLVPDRGGVVGFVAGRGEDVPGEVAVRHVGGNRFLDPRMKRERASSPLLFPTPLYP